MGGLDGHGLSEADPLLKHCRFQLVLSSLPQGDVSSQRRMNVEELQTEKVLANMSNQILARPTVSTPAMKQES